MHCSKSYAFRTINFCLLKHRAMSTTNTIAYFFTCHTCLFMKVGRSSETLPRRYYRLIYMILIIFSDVCSYFTFFYVENLSFYQFADKTRFPFLTHTWVIVIFSQFLFFTIKKQAKKLCLNTPIAMDNLRYNF